MSVSGVGSSPLLQWLQNYLSPAGSAANSSSSSASRGCQSTGDTTSISQQAVQLNATQAGQLTDPSQPSDVNGSQGHHHHHHHHGGGQGNGQGNGSFIDQLAQSIVTDLQQATASGASSESSTAGASGSTSTGGSFIDKLASTIANDLLAQYQQSTGSASTPSTRQVNAVA